MGELINIAVKYRMLLLNGAKITLIVSVLTIIFGLICGILMAFMKMSKIKILKIFANIYVEFIRGTPVLVQIFLVYYGLPIMGVQVPSIVISRIVSGTLALVINTTAYVCEIVRGGIESIDYGQTEGALALGMKPGRAMLAIVFPQAMKNILPSLGINLPKGTFVVGMPCLANLNFASSTLGRMLDISTPGCFTLYFRAFTEWVQKCFLVCMMEIREM